MARRKSRSARNPINKLAEIYVYCVIAVGLISSIKNAIKLGFNKLMDSNFAQIFPTAAVLVGLFVFLAFALWKAREKTPVNDKLKNSLEIIQKYQSLNQLLNLDPREFEEVIAHYFRLLGYENVSVTKATGDGGKDIVGYERLDTGELREFYVEVKRYNVNHKITVELIRRLKGSMVGHVNMGFFVTTSDFTKPAITRARELGIKLINGTQLINEFNRISREYK